MDFGSLPNIEGVDFRLPPDPPRTREVLKRRQDLREALGPEARTEARAEVRLGCPIWSKKEWVGSVFPPKTPVARFLEHYARQFDTVELNSSFYGIPPAANILKWKETVGQEFRFCAKVFQGISHEMDSPGLADLVAAFLKSMEGFEDRLGLCFLQLPPDFTTRGFPLLQRLLTLLPDDFPLAFEFRHRSWFEDQQLKRPVWDLMQERQVSAVITDVAGRRDVSHASLATDQVMVRFVGNGLHATDYTRIQAWAERLAGPQGWLRTGLSKLYFIVHQPDDTLSPPLVDFLARELQARGVPGIKRWTPHSSEPPSNPPGQMDLF